MVEHFFVGAPTRARLRAGQMGPFVDGFAAALKTAGYAWDTARGYLRASAHFGRWAEAEGLGLAALDEQALVGFAQHFSRCACLRRNVGRYADAVAGARHFLTQLRACGVVPLAPAPATRALPELVEGFEEWMRGHRGVSERTLQGYRPILVDLLRERGDPRDFTAGALRAFVLDRAAPHGREHAKKITKAVRMFLRYAVAHGRCAARLVDAIPTIAHWRLASLPAYLLPADVERLVRAPAETTPVGRRDRAMVLLLARLGLRAGDLVALRLGDLDWQGGTVLVTGKGRRATRLPLPQDAGDALLAYLNTGRPDVGDDHVFLRLRAPVGRLRHQVTVAEAVHRAAQRAGVRLPRGGGHVLRHSLATALLRAGAPLSTIGLVLRHRSEETTAHYAKLDVLALRPIAQGWPLEVPSC